MSVLIDASTTMMLPLLRRRPEVDVLGRFVLSMTNFPASLDVASQQLLGRIFRAAWLVVGLWRAQDTAQPVFEQLELARLDANLRQFSVALGRYYPNAKGRLTLALTADAAVAFSTLESWDPMTVATFDTTAAMLRVALGVRFQ